MAVIVEQLPNDTTTVMRLPTPEVRTGLAAQIWTALIQEYLVNYGNERAGIVRHPSL